MNVLLSIKPRYVEKIISGKKRYEFRKVGFKETVGEVYTYSSFPVKKIVGKFHVGQIIEDHPKNLWSQLQEFSGINEDEFFSYFKGKNNGFAISIDDMVTFDTPIDPWEMDSSFNPPQSFQYLKDSLCLSF
ncbi:putative transcriptional regulator [Methanomicrobium sp. W14]|uniref:ASCH domain-containing protein n=1 Tax=Methanomicrobium sp. W14 TaxID=2817839 RepID=UPI001AE3E553|nr:ASCH domain-containing protein [Methanomicrobium sp. W14]MBP2134241.1 putative transcriptional regulator [Methanomicrobium sp. W14]